jgi:hypothetical protein
MNLLNNSFKFNFPILDFLFEYLNFYLSYFFLSYDQSSKNFFFSVSVCVLDIYIYIE